MLGDGDLGMTCHDNVTFVSLIFGVEEMVEMEEMVHGRLKHFRAKAKGWFEWVEFEPFGVDMCFFCGLSWLCVVDLFRKHMDSLSQKT